MMSSYWANFAAAGDPNGKGLPQWDAVGDRPEVMEVGDKTGPVPLTASASHFAFFEKFLTSPDSLTPRVPGRVEGSGSITYSSARR